MNAPRQTKLNGRKLFALPCNFVMGVAQESSLPRPRMPEVALAGRSNVGKSSLVNSLTGKKTLAKTSVTPGRTQQLNFFNLGDRLMIVDMPGYGYAKAPKAMVDQWHRLMTAYLLRRESLKRVCVLVDARHGIKPVDEEMFDLLDEVAVMYHVVLTKADKLGKGELATRLAETQEALSRHSAAHPQIYATSAVNKHGIDELKEALAALI